MTSTYGTRSSIIPIISVIRERQVQPTNTQRHILLTLADIGNLIMTSVNKKEGEQQLPYESSRSPVCNHLGKRSLQVARLHTLLPLNTANPLLDVHPQESYTHNERHTKTVIKHCFVIRKQKSRKSALAGVAQWIECRPAKQRVDGSIPSQGTCLGCGAGPQLGPGERQPHICVSLPVLLPTFPSL